MAVSHPSGQARASAPNGGDSAGGPVARHLEGTLRAALAPTRLELRDDSHLHAGHSGAREGGHFHVLIESACFAGCNRVARHRLIYDALGPLGAIGVHALSIDAREPPAG
jgi:BolA family transcriptional regulator, general stress-responsive regulator